MKKLRIDLSRRYHAALQTYLRHGPGSSLEPARVVGRLAISEALETLDLARIHEIALIPLLLPTYSTALSKTLIARAGLFFAEAITPIEETHRGAREANVHLNQVVKALRLRSLELADSVEGLKLEIAQRKATEDLLKVSEQTSSQLLAHSLKMQGELRDLSHQLLTAQEEERKRISRELHDVIAQTLTSINMRLASLKSDSVTNTKDLQKKITSTQRMVAKSVDIVHRFARELRPSILDDLGLIPAFKSYLKGYTEEAGIPVKFTACSEVEQIEAEQRTALYRVAQEALTNVRRHAKASKVEIVITNIADGVRMEIKDDGKGFEVEGKTSSRKTGRLGLLGMRERVEMVGGTFCVDSAPGKHTTVLVEMATGAAKKKRLLSNKSKPSTPLECP